jgi:hypothetical protein
MRTRANTSSKLNFMIGMCDMLTFSGSSPSGEFKSASKSNSKPSSQASTSSSPPTSSTSSTSANSSSSSAVLLTSMLTTGKSTPTTVVTPRTTRSSKTSGSASAAGTLSRNRVYCNLQRARVVFQSTDSRIYREVMGREGLRLRRRESQISCRRVILGTSTPLLPAVHFGVYTD